MSVWTYLTGVIHIDSTTSEDELLAAYQRVSHLLVGSEGGANISFTKTTRKNFSSSAEGDYRVEPFTRIDNMVIQGYFRDFGSDKALEALEGIKHLLRLLKERHIARSASFTMESTDCDYYYNISLVCGRVRSQKVKVKY